MKIILIYLGPGCHPQKTYPKQTTSQNGGLEFHVSNFQTDPMTASRRVKPLTSDFGLCLGGLVDTPKRENTEKQGNLKQRVYVSISRYLPWKQGISSSLSSPPPSSSSSSAAAAAALLQNRKMFAIFEASKPPGFGFSHIFFWFRSLGIDGFFPTGNLRR